MGAMVVEILGTLLKLFSRDFEERRKAREQFRAWVDRSGQNADASALAEKGFEDTFKDLEREVIQSKPLDK